MTVRKREREGEMYIANVQLLFLTGAKAIKV